VPEKHNLRRSGRRSRLHAPKGAMPNSKVSQAAFARLLGCTRARVNQLVKQGAITAAALTPEGEIIPPLAVKQLQEAGCFADDDAQAVDATAAIAKIATVADPGLMSFDDARAAHETLRAHLALLDLRHRRAELVEASLAESVLFAAMRAVRDGLQTWPVRVTPEMAARLGVPPGALLAELQSAVRAFLTGLAEPKADWRRTMGND
jgi:hypothetical protein